MQISIETENLLVPLGTIKTLPKNHALLKHTRHLFLYGTQQKISTMTLKKDTVILLRS